MTADHIRECPDCRQVLADVVHVDREYDGVVVPMRRGAARWPWWLAVAAAALAVVVSLALWRPWSRPETPLHTLIAAAPRDRRVIEARLSGGFPWAPLRVHRANSEPLDAAQMKFVGAAGTVLERTDKDASPAARHAAAIAHLVAGRPKEAADLLQALTASPASDGRIWSDLAAARYALALQTDDASYLAGALAAADEALRRTPTLPEARFNRALTVDRLGLRDQARDAWQQYLAVDPSSGWAKEAARHLSNLAPRSTFKDVLERDYARLQNDEAAARALAERFPQEARVWGESEILCRWARAHLAGDRAEAEGHLRVARFFGNLLAERSGERMLHDAVAAVDRASADQRFALARAHVSFRVAQDEFDARRYSVAEKHFVEAAHAFERARSPLSLVARYLSINTIFDQGRNAVARAELEQLAADAPADYASYRAQLQWQLGLAYGSAVRWGDAIQMLEKSIAEFERLGEFRNAARVREILAEVYDQIGDERTAWKHRFIVLGELGHAEDRRLQVAIDSAARASTLESQWLAASSFLTLELGMARRSSDNFRVAQTLVLRALVAGRLNDSGAAAADLAAAARVVARLPASQRERAEIDRVAAVARLTRSPAQAIPLLNAAIAYHRDHGRRMFLPDLYLHRSRAYRALDDAESAMNDADAGITELERQRSSLQSGEERWGVFSTGEELFDDAIALAVARGDDEQAFNYAERARARQLLESLGVEQPATMTGAIPRDQVLVEYASSPSTLLIFIVANGRVAIVRRDVSRASLEGAATRLAGSIAARDSAGVRAEASRLYDHLIAPVAHAFPAGRMLVVVPDATLRAVPFAALMNRSGRYLIEERAVIVAPSAAVFARLAQKRLPATAHQRLLLIEGPAANDGSLAALPSQQREVDGVVAPYGEFATIGLKDADRTVFERSAAAADVVHFVGHAVTSDAGRDASLVISRSAGPAGRLDARGIASMSLESTRVVVLAACGSARGEERAGEGAISVARGFLAAGVPSVIATLWPIDDSAAADFFPRVHRHLAAGRSPADALRAAQLECIHQRAEPLDMWAAVQVLGT